MFSLPCGADETRLEGLLAQLRQAPAEQSGPLAREIEQIWAQSGSASADLLLKRGEQALEAGDTGAALAHLGALTDHAPDFAEGWHAYAIALAEAGRFGPAIAAIERALAIEPRQYNAMASLGGILLQIDRPAMALQVFRLALAIYPHNKEIAEALDMAARRIGDRDL